MAERLNFEKQRDIWLASVEIKGNTVVQLNREEAGVVSVTASIDGFENEVPIAQFQNGFTPNVIFQLNIPVGVEVRIKSQTEVLGAWMLVAE